MIISFLLISVEVFIVVLIFILNPPELSVNSSPIADKVSYFVISCYIVPPLNGVDTEV